MTEYERGFQDGKADRRIGLGGCSNRLWNKQYRDGYSDGFRKGATW